MGEICSTPSPQHQHNNWFHCGLKCVGSWAWQLSRKRARAFTTYLLSTHAGHKDPSSVTLVNVANRDSTKHAFTHPAPPLVFTKSTERIYSETTSNHSTTSMLSWITEEIHRLRSHDTVWHNDPLSPRVILQASCSKAAHGSQDCVSITPAWRWRRSRPDRKEARAQCQTSWHPRRHTIGLRSPGADHKGLWVAWMEAATFWAHLSWKNMFLSLRRVGRTTGLWSRLNTAQHNNESNLCVGNKQYESMKGNRKSL